MEFSEPSISLKLMPENSLLVPQGPTPITLVLAENSITHTFSLVGTFQTTLSLPGSPDPVPIAASATLNHAGGIDTLDLSGQTTGSIAIPNFQCLSFGPLHLSAQLTLGPVQVGKMC